MRCHRLRRLRTIGRFLLLLLLGAVLPLVSAASRVSAAAPAYTITDLAAGHAYGINEAGQVIGDVIVAKRTADYAFLWQGGNLTVLGTLGGLESSGSSLNNAGQVVGRAATSDNRITHAFLWQDGTMRDLGTLGGPDSGAIDINNAGQVVGSSTTAAGQAHAFLWQDGTMRDLGTLGGTTSRGTGINDAGQVVGSSTTAAGQAHAFLWQGGIMRDLGTLGGTTSRGTSINDAGQVVGSSRTGTDRFQEHAFVFRLSDNRMSDLGTLPGFPSSAALDINNAGQIVGILSPSSRGVAGGAPEERAFLYRDNTMVDLNTFLPAGSGWILQSASGINNRGQIVGSGTLNGQSRAFLLNPDTSSDLPGMPNTGHGGRSEIGSGDSTPLIALTAAFVGGLLLRRRYPHALFRQARRLRGWSASVRPAYYGPVPHGSPFPSPPPHTRVVAASAALWGRHETEG